MVKMKKIDSDYDELLKSNYDLFAVRFSDLKKEVKSWYSDLGGNDSTRINIFNFFYGIELKLNNLV